MANKKKEEGNSGVEVAGDAQKAPQEQTKGDTQQPQMNVQSGQNISLEGNQKAVVNPRLDTLTVSIPTGVNEDTGQVEYDNFSKGNVYEVDAKILEIKNAEGVPLLVDPDADEEGGE